MIVVGVAMIGSLTVLPAVLSRLGDKVEKGRIPFLHRLRRDTGEGSRFWGAILEPVLRHPAISAVAAGAVLVALAVPALPAAHRRQRARRAARRPAGAEGVPRARRGLPGRRQSREVAIKVETDTAASARRSPT